jgi:hypothetical protein
MTLDASLAVNAAIMAATVYGFKTVLEWYAKERAKREEIQAAVTANQISELKDTVGKLMDTCFKLGESNARTRESIGIMGKQVVDAKGTIQQHALGMAGIRRDLGKVQHALATLIKVMSEPGDGVQLEKDDQGNYHLRRRTKT